MNNEYTFKAGDKVRFKSEKELITEVRKYMNAYETDSYTLTMIAHANESYIINDISDYCVHFVFPTGTSHLKVFNGYRVLPEYLILDNETKLTINDNIPTIYADGEYNVGE